MLEDIAHEDFYQAEFLLGDDLRTEGDDDMVTKLCDFMLQQKSPKALTEADPRVEMGGSYNKPKFGPIVTIVSHLVRCQYTASTNED